MNKKKISLLVILTALFVALVALMIFLFGFYLPKKSKEAELERLVREYYENKLSTYREENERYSDYEIDVAFLGDSLTDGCDLQKYYPEYNIANRGIGGETTFGLEERLGTSIYDLKPKIAVVLIGGNNLDTMLQNYENIIVGIRENLPDTKIIICSLTAMGGELKEKNKIAALNNVTLKKLAAKHECTFVDVFTPLFDESTREIYASFTTDGAHLTHEGYSVLTGEIKRAIEDLLLP